MIKKRKLSNDGRRLPPSQRLGGFLTGFTKKVLAAAKKIPRGKTVTYKEIARLAGSPRAYRAVGNILNKNYNPGIPCHRVICSSGKTGGYNRGAKKKLELLKKEGAI